MEWWFIAGAIAWLVFGFLAWLFVVLQSRELTTGDLVILPFCMMFGPLTWVIYFTSNLDSVDHTIWRW